MPFDSTRRKPERSLRRIAPAKTSTPALNNAALPGSGTGGVLPPLKPLLFSSPVPWQPIETLFESIVTAPACAKARPQSMVAPVPRVMLWEARMFPANAVPVPRVAELPTFQNKASSGLEPRLMKVTPDELAVVSVLPIKNIQPALSLPCASRVTIPVN